MQLRHELDLIERLQYAPYFLTVDSIVRFARSKGILCQGRGSAANSAVCYVLGVTSIDPVRQGLLFERFVSEERREPPGYRCRFRARAARGSHPVDLRDLWQDALGPDRRLCRAIARAARCAKSARRLACRKMSQARLPASSGAGARKASPNSEAQGAQPQSCRPPPAPDAGTRPPAHRHAAPSVTASGRLCADAGSP